MQDFFKYLKEFFQAFCSAAKKFAKDLVETVKATTKPGNTKPESNKVERILYLDSLPYNSYRMRTPPGVH